jgi:hypothetical protein
MRRNARLYTIYQKFTESVDCQPHRLDRKTVTRIRWVRVGARAFPYAEAQQYYRAMMDLDSALALRPVPKGS